MKLQCNIIYYTDSLIERDSEEAVENYCITCQIKHFKRFFYFDGLSLQLMKVKNQHRIFTFELH